MQQAFEFLILFNSNKQFIEYSIIDINASKNDELYKLHWIDCQYNFAFVTIIRHSLKVP